MESSSRLRRLRRIGYPLALAGVRLRGRPGRTILPPIGIALAAALLAGVLSGGLAAEDAALGRAAQGIPEPDRAVRATWGGLPGEGTPGFGALDQAARRALAPVIDRRPLAVALFRERRLGGALVTLSAMDDPSSSLRLSSGRLPRTCRPTRCEVVQLAGTGPLPGAPGLRIVRVGRASAVSSLAFGSLLSSGSAAAVRGGRSSASASPFLLARGVEALSRAQPLAFDYRTYTWLVPLTTEDVHPWSVDALGSRVDRARSALAAGGELFDVSAPEEELAAAAARARDGARRLLLLGGEALALLLAFSVLAAVRLRRETEASWRRLTWSGASRWQLLAGSAGEVGGGALAGTAVGWALGLGLGALVARHLGASPGAVLRHGVLADSGLLLALALAVGAGAVVFASLVARPVQLGVLSVSAVDLAAAAAAAVLAVAFVRGDVGTGTAGSTRGTGTVLLLVPGLIALISAIVTVRIVHPLFRLLERAGRRLPVPFRLASLSLARRPGQAALVAAFGAVSIGLALFAETYRATLVRGQRDQATFAVPSDAVLSEDLSKLVAVGEAAPLSRYAQLGSASPVVRLSGDVPGPLGSEGMTLLGVPAATVGRLDGWRGDFAAHSPAELGRRIEPSRPVATQGVPLGAGARAIVFPARRRGGSLVLHAVIETARGAFVSAELERSTRTGELRARLPREAAGGKLVAIAADLPPTGIHDSGNGASDVTPRAQGQLLLEPPRVETPSGSRTLPVNWALWIGTGGIELHDGGREAAVRYVVTPDRDALLRLRQATDGRPVPVIASPRVAVAAGPGGIVQLDLTGQILPVRIVATARRFPSTSGDFVVADRATLSAAMNASFPGSAVTSEIWLHRAAGLSERKLEGALEQPPFDDLAVASRSRLEATLRGDPLARGALLALEAGAVLALALGLAGLLLAVLSDLGDERAELVDLEAQGATPAALRQHLCLRAAVGCVLGLAAGVGVGAALSRIVVRLVALTANVAAPEPPLVLAVDWPVATALTSGYVLLAALLIAVPTWRAFRDPSR